MWGEEDKRVTISYGSGSFLFDDKVLGFIQYKTKLEYQRDIKVWMVIEAQAVIENKDG